MSRTIENHWKTHLFTYAVSYWNRANFTPEDLASIRDKAIRAGHTEGQCQRVEFDPAHFIKTGRLATADNPHKKFGPKYDFSWIKRLPAELPDNRQHAEVRR